MKPLKNGWEKYREHHLERLKRALENKEVDEPAVPVLEAVNSSPYYVTTSSCSGRTVLLETLPDERKIESAFFRKWHDFVSPEEVWKAINEYSGEKILWFKYDPLIFHIAAKTLGHALLILKAARASGIKVAGIQYADKTKYHIEVRGIDHMATPVYDKKVLVDEEYVKYLVTTANRKHRKNLVRLKKFEKEINRILDVF